ncbi:MAG: hypothetical protein A2W22_04420 [Candidatus Levybacteria bacterium RBG_16_35_11]|nr:MAG: hypothetical protein A2W22_04420 [Candidatus Levybacteria bacterium RBG_16_35_11]
MKLQKLLFIVLILVVLIGLVPLFSSSFYLSHDGQAHVARFAAYYKSFLDGQFPLRWAGDLNYRYGSPVFIFFYPLPGIIAIFLHLLGASFENTYKFIVGFSFILSFISFYIWTKEHFRKEVAIAGSIIYGLVPYHILNMYVRGGIGEILAVAILPLCFYFIDKIIKEKAFKHSVFGGIVFAFLILSHNSVSFLFAFILLAYGILNLKEKKDLLNIFYFFTLGISLAAFFWIPALLYGKYINASLLTGDIYKIHFASIWKLIYSPWGFGPNVNEQGGLSPQVSIPLFVLSLASFFLIIKLSYNRKNIIFWLFVFALGIFLSNSISSFIWQKSSFLKLFQFPWRMMVLSSFASSVLATYVINSLLKKKIFFLLIIVFIIVPSFFLIQTRQIPQKSDSFYLNYRYTTYYFGEATSIWTAGDFGEFPKAPLEIFSGGKFKQITRKSNLHIFETKTKKDSGVVDNTVYFPGWHVKIDGKEVPIQFQDPNYRGLITFNVPKGNHIVEVKFRETKLNLVSDFISLGSLIFVIIYLLFMKKNSVNNRKIHKKQKKVN